MRLFSSTKTLLAALILLLAPLATSTFAAHHEKGTEKTSVASTSQAPGAASKTAEDTHGAHDDHGEKKSFPLGALSFAFVVLGILLAPAYHRLNVGGDFTGAISSREDTGGH